MAKQPAHIIVTCEYCKARLAVPREEDLPTCYICGGRMLPEETFEEGAKC